MDALDELAKETLAISKELETSRDKPGWEHGCSPLAWELSMIQQAHYDRVNEDARKTKEEIRRRLGAERRV